MYQRYMICRMAEEYDLVGAVLQVDPGSRGTLVSRLKRYRSPAALIRHVLARLLVHSYDRRALPLVSRLFYAGGRPPDMPAGAPVIRVADVNVPNAVRFVQRLKPDVICVNGTNLLREPMLELIPRVPYGIINLHTGLSPYARGGNCNLFMLLEGRPELVGATVHHIDPGIDSGDIILSARPDLAPEDLYETIEAKAFHLGREMMIAAVRQLVQGRAERVRQWEEGRLFLRRTGYVYEPWQRVRANRMIRRGLIADYLGSKEERDRGIRLVGELP